MFESNAADAEFADKIDLQRAVFAETPSMVALLAAKVPPKRIFHISCLRNATFELAEPWVNFFASYLGWRFSFSFSAFDDSLSQVPAAQADAVILWLDFSRYQARSDPTEFQSWLEQRLQFVRSHTQAPILLVNSPAEDAAAEPINRAVGYAIGVVPGVRLIDLRLVAQSVPGSFFDSRQLVPGERSLTRQALALTARALTFGPLAACLSPRLKAICVDLDETLHQGILVDDGMQAVRVSAAHQELQRTLKGLRSDGILLGLVSRNTEEDVRALLSRHSDYILGWDDFHVHRVGFEPKVKYLNEIAHELNIGIDSILFIDDNTSELFQCYSRSGLTNLIAAEEPVATSRALKLYPRLYGYPIGAADSKRGDDAVANKERQVLQSSAATEVEYLAQIQAQIQFSFGSLHSLPRMFELSQKTNQFNLNGRRLSEAAIAARIDTFHVCTATASLRDKFADSGTILLISGELKEGMVEIDELCISCRALGRFLEDHLIYHACAAFLERMGAQRLGFYYKELPRNLPALTWLRNLPSIGERPDLFIEIDMPSWRKIVEGRAQLINIGWSNDVAC